MNYSHQESDLASSRKPVVQESVEEIIGSERRSRRRRSQSFDKSLIAHRVITLAEDDMRRHATDRSRRLDRYAKYRQWTSGKEGPWDGSSDQAIPDMTATSLRTQDTLHNAVMSTRPAVVSRALQKKDQDKQETIDDLLDAQLFIEQPGEQIIGELAEQFTNDGVFTAFVRWVRETRPYTEVKKYPEIPSDQPAVGYFRQLLLQNFPNGQFTKDDKEGWDWNVQQPKLADISVRFFAQEGQNVEMQLETQSVVYEGPRVTTFDYEDVLRPERCGNLQIPGPSNPDGAPHVILVDTPTIDEIKRLASGKRPFYDELSKEDLDALDAYSKDQTNDDAKTQKDAFQGETSQSRPDDPLHRTLTRYLCFDTYDMDGDGVAEDIVWWVLRETKQLLRWRKLSEVYPFKPIRRPLAEANYVGVRGRREGIGLLELMEGLHDWLKEVADFGMDAGSLQVMPWGFYRASSSVKPEVYGMSPGDMMPVSDPQRDVFFPSFQGTAGAFAFNTMSVIQQLEERLTLTSELNYGRVPNGKASALRTVGGLQTILDQGEARPERVLRRFFMGLTDVFRMMHQLNQAFLPPGKQFRLAGYAEPDKNPYRVIEKPGEIEGDYTFDFNANVMNSSKAAVQQGLQQLQPLLINPLMLQLGITTPDTIYRMVLDYGKSLGQNIPRYIHEPTPGAGGPQILAEEAISAILDGQTPQGTPLEDPQEHLAKLQAFHDDDSQFGLLDPKFVPIFGLWQQKIAALIQQQQQQQALMANAQSLQQKLGPGGGGQGGGAAPPDTSQAPLQPNELQDESLPGAKQTLQ